jgi:hypothetical protein
MMARVQHTENETMSTLVIEPLKAGDLPRTFTFRHSREGGNPVSR